MATKTAIQQFIATLEIAGLLTERKGAPPVRIAAQRESLAAFWSALMHDVTDQQLEAGLVGFLNDPTSCQWYPQPGTIRFHAPGVTLPPTTNFGRDMAEIQRQIDEEEAHGIEDGSRESDPAAPQRRLLQ